VNAYIYNRDALFVNGAPTKMNLRELVFTLKLQLQLQLQYER